MASDIGGSDPFVGTVEDRAAALMVSDPALVAWLVGGAAAGAAVTGGAETTRADRGTAPGTPGQDEPQDGCPCVNCCLCCPRS